MERTPEASSKAWLEKFEQLRTQVTATVPPSELETRRPDHLVEIAAECLTLAVETAARSIDDPALTEEVLVHDALAIVADPTPAALVRVFCQWRKKHPLLTETQLVGAPVFLLTG